MYIICIFMFYYILSPVDDMVRDKFVFSIRDLQVKERLLRVERLTLEKAISMARASEALKEQIKVMGPKKQNVNIELKIRP